MALALAPDGPGEQPPSGAGLRTSGSFQLFASAPSDPRARRPVDRLRAVGFLLLLLPAIVLSQIAGDLDRALSEALTSLPGFLRLLWLSGIWLTVGWSITLLVIAGLRHRPPLSLEALGAGALAAGLSLVVGTMVSGDPRELAITSSVLAVMAPYLTLPGRRFGRVLIAGQMLGALFLGDARPLGATAALAIGLLSGTTMHLLRGSPGGFPTVTRVKAALGDLGVDVDRLTPTAMRREGVAVLAGTDGYGPFEVRVYGRDAWEGELVADLWRLTSYRRGRRRARLSRSEYVEHEGFMTMLAARGGARVPEVVTAGLADNGDALIVIRPDGSPLGEANRQLTSGQVRSLWDQLGRLHAGGIAHHRIDLDRVVTFGDSSAGFSDLSSASVRSDERDAIADRAQLLALTTVTSGKDVALDHALSALGRDRLIAVLSYLQEPTLPTLIRAELRRRRIELDTLRTELAETLGVAAVELTKLRRVTWKSLLNLVLLAVAAYTIIGMISGLDLDAYRRAIANASRWWLLAALLIAQLPRLSNALSTIGSTPESLPFGPTAALQFAITYVNLAVPSAAGRLTMITRFFQRFGIPTASALSAGVIDSLSEFLVEITLLVLVFFTSDVDLGLSLNTDQLSGVAIAALIVVAVLIVAGGLVSAVPSLRRRALGWLRQARDTLAVLRAPRKLLQLFGGNLLSELLFAAALGACVRAFGFGLPFGTLILVNTVVSLFAGLLPVPGGVGVAEAGLSLGLTKAGIPSEAAFAIALTYRFATFYLPPIWGLLSYRWMTSRRYL